MRLHLLPITGSTHVDWSLWTLLATKLYPIRCGTGKLRLERPSFLQKAWQIINLPFQHSKDSKGFVFLKSARLVQSLYPPTLQQKRNLGLLTPHIILVFNANLYAQSHLSTGGSSLLAPLVSISHDMHTNFVLTAITVRKSDWKGVFSAHFNRFYLLLLWSIFGYQITAEVISVRSKDWLSSQEFLKELKLATLSCILKNESRREIHVFSISIRRDLFRHRDRLFWAPRLRVTVCKACWLLRLGLLLTLSLLGKLLSDGQNSRRLIFYDSLTHVQSLWFFHGILPSTSIQTRW